MSLIARHDGGRPPQKHGVYHHDAFGFVGRFLLVARAIERTDQSRWTSRTRAGCTRSTRARPRGPSRSSFSRRRTHRTPWHTACSP